MDSISSCAESPGRDQRGKEDPDLQSLMEERAFQALIDGPIDKRSNFTYCDDDIAQDNEFSTLTFPRKLWKIVESEQFNSISWNYDGTHVVIDEELFKTEVLQRRVPFRIFETNSMKSFIRQLNLYGFTKIRQNFQRSASLPEFLAEEKAATAFSKLYYNPNFNRDYPHLLRQMKRRVGIKNARSTSSPLEYDFGNTSTQNAESGGNFSKRNSHQASYEEPPNKRPSTSMPGIRNSCEGSLNPDMPPTPNNPFNHMAEEKAATAFSKLYYNPNFNRDYPHLLRQMKRRVGIKKARSTSSPLEYDFGNTSTQNAESGGNFSKRNSHQASYEEPPNKRPSTSMPGIRNSCEGSLNPDMPPTPNNPFNNMMGLPAFQSMCPDLSAMQTYLASLLPFCNTWLSMSMIAAASAISMSQSSPHQSSIHQCPYCKCSAGSNAPSATPSNGRSSTPD